MTKPTSMTADAVRMTADTRFHIRVRDAAYDGWYVSARLVSNICASGNFPRSSGQALSVQQNSDAECVWTFPRVSRAGTYGLYNVRSESAALFVYLGTNRNVPFHLSDDASHAHAEWMLVSLRPQRTILCCPEHGVFASPVCWQVIDCDGHDPVLTYTMAFPSSQEASLFELEPISS